MADFEVAYRLAADLAGAKVDVNEAQKVLAYVRTQDEGRALFDYLRTINDSGGEVIVIRSNQTLDYYRQLQIACERHLRPLQNDFNSLIQTFAWSLRLLRYYRAVPDVLPSALQPNTSDEPKHERKNEPAFAVPEVGDIFTDKILEVGEAGVVLQVPGFAVEKVVALITPEHKGTRKYRANKDTARVEVIGVRTLKNGRVMLDVKPAPRPKKE
ncbi:hypothetical protein [Candidatus Chloroploca sp. Khr17]|uniref:hypothetical protein n=1 Tax=Candidatus Chloroploca sp. Khr17 TaxID=2496869 RepID=UPI00101D945C|nr:hypothetical protein [Candidatus Chloroploca sp. Khr17]